MKTEVTIYDIAKRLNLSPATVSRSLRDNPKISQKTKKRVTEAAEKLGYRTNYFASRLRQKQTKTIGVIVHELNSTFITSVLTGIEKEASPNGYDILIAHSSENEKKEKTNAKNLFEKRVDGIIASLSFNTKDLSHFKPFKEHNVPVIFFDRVEQDGNNTVVVIDNSHCGYIATKHLVEQGCKRIAHITSNPNRNVYSKRFKGYKEALEENDIPFDENLVFIGNLSEESALDSTSRILKMNPLPDGIFITNDFVAAVVMRELKKAGLKIPDDVAIVGFNNDTISTLVEPELSTINYPGVDMGEIAARNLISHLKGSSDLSQTNTIIVRSNLIIRASSLRKK